MPKRTNPHDVMVGDTVRIQPYRTATMSGVWVDGVKSGMEGMVMRLISGDSWIDQPTHAAIRVLLDNGQHAIVVKHELQFLDLVQKGDGTFEIGRTQPFSGAELRNQRLQAWEQRLAKVDTRYQGTSNAATFLAILYLSQAAATYQEVRALRRADGSIHPHRLQKLFYRHRLTIDAWALAPALSVPGEFQRWAHRWRQRVNWQEVADHFQERR